MLDILFWEVDWLQYSDFGRSGCILEGRAGTMSKRYRIC